MHSNIVGGSTAKRVMACPGSVVLVQRMPPSPSSKYAEEGTMLHGVIEQLLDSDGPMPADLTEDQKTKLEFCLSAIDEIDPNKKMTYATEVRVAFADNQDIFGSVDLIGRVGDTAIVLDWKFGDGVMVEAEESPQGLFYAAAAMETKATQWAFYGATELEIIIVQPPHIRRWVTTFDRVAQFKKDLMRAVRLAGQPDAPLEVGDHCRWCAAKPICPKMTGLAERTLQTQLAAIDGASIGVYLKQADLVEDWIKSLRELAFTMLENDRPVPGYKLVAKRAIRQWADEEKAKHFLHTHGAKIFKEPELISPAQAEKELKKSKLTLPDDLVVSVSSGSTLAPEDDPRPAVLNIGRQLTAALFKLR